MQANPTMKKSSLTQRRQFNSTFESEASVEQREEKFSIKKELYRGIKDNDVSKIAGKPDDKDMDTNFIYNEYDEAHRMLTDIRRQYDDVKATTQSRKKEIELQKKELEDLHAQEKMLSSQIKTAKQELQKAEERFKQQFEDCESSLLTRDIYLTIQEHTKQDNIIIKERIFYKELELAQSRSRFRSTLNDATNKRKIDQQCQKMLHSMERVVEFEKRKRELRINSMQEVIDKKQESFIKKLQRDKETEKVIITALNEKSPQEKEWIKLLLTNKLLGSILKSKIERELSKHSDIEKAFHNIKLHTGVTHCDVFVEKFLNREQDYGELLNSISEKEPKLQKQQQLNESLKQRQRDLLDDREAVQPTQKQTESPAIRSLMKELEHLEHKQVCYQRQKQAFYQWAVKFLKKYDNLTDTSKKRNHMNYYEFYPRTDIVTLYRKVATIITKNLDDIAPKEQMVNVILLKNSMREPTLSDKYYEKNVRIKTLHQESTVPDREDDIDFMEDTSETDYLQDFRKIVKKDARNRRFRVKTKPF